MSNLILMFLVGVDTVLFIYFLAVAKTNISRAIFAAMLIVMAATAGDILDKELTRSGNYEAQL